MVQVAIGVWLLGEKALKEHCRTCPFVGRQFQDIRCAF